MALFYSLSPPLGARNNRNAAELFSIELSLLLPQDRFLPAREIQAQVWTNIIHKHNPEGPSVWKEISMAFSHVEHLPKSQPLPSHLAGVATQPATSEAPAQCIAVFRTHLIPTGRGDFGLTCRWKSHRDQEEWQWATRVESENGEISVRIPRNYASSSSWTLGPQSVLVMTKNGLRKPGVTLSTGPGLYLGNHGAATKAKLSGYEAVLSLVSDILDFDEKIPDPDDSASKNLWDPVKHQQQVEEMKQQLKEFAQRQEENEALSNGDQGHSRAPSGTFSLGSLSRSPSYLGISRRSSVSDLGVHLKSNGDHKAAGVEDDDDGPRLSRKTSVTDLMVKPPSGRRLQSRSSVASLNGVDANVQEHPDEEQDVASGKSKTVSKTNSKQQQQQQTTTKPPSSSGKKSKHQKSASKSDPAALPPPSATSKGTTKSNTNNLAADAVEGGKGPVTSPVIHSLAVGTSQQTGTKTITAAGQSHEAGESNDKTTTATGEESTEKQERPPSSGRVLSAVADHGQETNAQYRSRMSSSSTVAALSALTGPESTSSKSADGSKDSDESKAKKKPFSHKVIALSPGAHRPIADKDLKEAIEFLKNELAQDKKVLVHCRDGNGRSGSVVLAYMVSKCQEPHRIGYDEALQELWKWKCDVYPHQGLRQSIEKHADEWRDL